MSQLALELENVLQSLLNEHRKLLVLVETHQGALKSMSADVMHSAGEAINASRSRLVMLETRRRGAVLAIVKQHKLTGNVTLGAIADVFPQRRPFLLKLRDDLKAVTAQIARHTAISARVTGALLGHLNTVVRLLAGAVEQAGVYTRSGTPNVSRRIGAIEAVG